MRFEIEIWRDSFSVDFYEANTPEEIIKWFRKKWEIAYKWNQCSLIIYEIEGDFRYYVDFFKDTRFYLLHKYW